jgi:hypothetical protein
VQRGECVIVTLRIRRGFHKREHLSSGRENFSAMRTGCGKPQKHKTEGGEVVIRVQELGALCVLGCCTRLQMEEIQETTCKEFSKLTERLGVHINNRTSFGLARKIQPILWE